ncbi:sigma-70 family RNA polymerase sigma factor [Nocardioides marinquilinus]|uniref:sigma-70 family RNA polymerase sigma factor n=1 Tax=Nocardioides marinquilinus TaxID=1210400 RepID=UPI0031EA5190
MDDGDGFEAFVAVETPRLLRVAYGLTGNPHDAWDLVQESLVRVGVRWRRLHDQNPGGYAQTVLVRLDVDRHRRRRRETPSDRAVVADRPVELDAPIDPALVAALAVLPARQRAAVVLRTVEDLDHAAIAERLGCSAPTARTHLRRGLARLRDLLAAADTDAEEEVRPRA